MQPGVTRVGDNQILTLAAAGIANPYAFGGEDVQQALSEMLESILFTPLCDENGLFPEDGFLQEQRQLLETLDAEYNDKATYAMQRCVPDSGVCGRTRRCAAHRYARGDLECDPRGRESGGSMP